MMMLNFLSQLFNLFPPTPPAMKANPMNDAPAQAPQPDPSTMNVNQIPAAPVEAPQALAEENADPVMARRVIEAQLQAAADAQKQPVVSSPNVPEGLTPEQLANIAAGQPDPNAPQKPSTISTLKNMSSDELQQFCLALEAKLDHLTLRFENLVSENFKVPY